MPGAARNPTRGAGCHRFQVAKRLASSPRGLPSRVVRRTDLMLRSLSLKVAVLAVALPVVVLPLSTQTSSVSDPVGDANFNAPAFQDVVFVEVTKTASGDFDLHMEMAGAVPLNPPMPPPANAEAWWV